jgi:hypothetical protein
VPIKSATPSTSFPTPSRICSANRLRARGLQISQSPTAAGDDSGENPPPLDLYSVPFFLSCPCAHHWHVLFIFCLRVQSERPWPTRLPAGTTPMSKSGQRGLPRTLPPRHRLCLTVGNTQVTDRSSLVGVLYRSLHRDQQGKKGSLFPEAKLI